MIYQVKIQPGGDTLFVRPDETILEAALRQGYQFPWACQQAICGTCQGRIIAGKVHYDVPLYAITEEQQQAGEALFCSAKADSDLMIEIEGVSAPLNFPLRTIICNIIEVVQLNADIWKILLQQPPDDPLIYHAGQYVEMSWENAKEARPFSIANAPNTQVLEFHVRHRAENAFVSALLQQVKNQQPLILRGPYGKMRYQRFPAWPLLLIATGTGFAPMQALLQQLWDDPQHPPVDLCWGARTREDLYAYTQLQQWVSAKSRFNFYPVLSQREITTDWPGSYGWVNEAILQQPRDFTHLHVYASGHPEMVYALRDALMARGLPAQYFYSDWTQNVSIP